LAGVASGVISLSNFYGKSNAPAGTSVTVSYNYTYDAGNEIQDEFTYIVFAPGFSINGAAVNILYASYGYYNDVRSSEIALNGTLPKNHFTSISGNGATVYSASTSYWSQNGPTTTWQWYGSLFLAFPLNQTSGSSSTVLTYV
jgi:hypothetical protein